MDELIFWVGWLGRVLKCHVRSKGATHIRSQRRELKSCGTAPSAAITPS